MLAPSEQGMVQLGNDLKSSHRQQIREADVQKWRNDVLSVNRPRVNGFNQHETAESAREYARKIADSIPKSNGFHTYTGSDEDVGTRSDSATNSLPSPSGELTVTTSHERKYSDYSSASSQKSPTPPSQSSFSDYSSIYRSQASPPDSQRSDSPLKADLTTRINVNGAQTDRFSKKPNDDMGLQSQKGETGTDLALRKILSEASRKQLFSQLRCWADAAGLCANCRLPMYDNEERYTVNDSTYHRACFTCEVCGRELREQQFYLSDGRFYCKQDYLYNMERKVTRCAECKQPIQEMRSVSTQSKLSSSMLHLHCVRNVPGWRSVRPRQKQSVFKVYCLPDYHERFAPRCHRCKNTILPDENTGETVRIVALDNNYHVDCYSCEGCGLKLTDEGRCVLLSARKASSLREMSSSLETFRF
ncbi:LIM domain protein [Ostertagia ostertagi]